MVCYNVTFFSPPQVTTITFDASHTPPQAQLLFLAVMISGHAFGTVRGCSKSVALPKLGDANKSAVVDVSRNMFNVAPLHRTKLNITSEHLFSVW